MINMLAGKAFLSTFMTLILCGFAVFSDPAFLLSEVNKENIEKETIIARDVESRAVEGKKVKDEVLAQYQKIFIKQQSKSLSVIMEQFKATEGIYEADSSFKAANYLSPEGKHILVTLARISSDALDTWLFLVMNTKTLKIERVFDFVKASAIEKVQWLDENNFVVLSQNENLSGPPGELFVVDARAGAASKVDENVWQYFIDPAEGVHLFYEKSLKVDSPYGERQIINYNVLNNERRLVHEVEHPVTQFGPIGPLGGGTSFFGFEIHTYGDSFEPEVVKWWFDIMTGKTFLQKE